MSDEPNQGGGGSGQGTHGVMLLIGQTGYFIPSKDLRWFKLPPAVTAKARNMVASDPALAGQLRNDAVTLGAEFQLEGPILRFSSIEEHHITPSRRWC